MGIDTHALHLLRHARREHGPFGHAVTLGRQSVHLGPRALSQWFGDEAASGPLYCESLLTKHFGATSVDSIDNSDYEGATIVGDMNRPVPDHLVGKYDSVLDFGCTEHIFDVAQSLRNVVAMCKLGGIILHVVPANGYCGHGFYQFSPELFFSFYSEKNGFSGTEVYLADLLDTKHWYRVLPPQGGQRVNVRSNNEMYVIVVTKRSASSALSVQQSDYIHVWEAAAHATPVSKTRSGFKAGLRESLLAVPCLAGGIHALDSRLSGTAPKPLRGHPQLVKIDTESLW